jgi:hypothetical protein
MTLKLGFRAISPLHPELEVFFVGTYYLPGVNPLPA